MVEKLKRILIVFSIFIVLLSFYSCKYGTDNLFYSGNDVSKRVPNDLLVLPETFGNSEYNVLILSDSHFGVNKKNLLYEKLYNYLDSVKGTADFPQILVFLGDITDTGSREEFEQYKTFVDVLKSKYNIRVYNLLGNHDCYNSGWQNWKTFCYPYESLYKFETDNISFYCLDSASGVIGKKQFDIIKKSMEMDKKSKIVFSHVPLYTSRTLFGMADSYERNRLIDLFSRNNVKMVLSGHIHCSESFSMGAFYQQSISSFLYQDTFAVLKINETSKSIFFEEKKLK